MGRVSEPAWGAGQGHLTNPLRFVYERARLRAGPRDVVQQLRVLRGHPCYVFCAVPSGPAVLSDGVLHCTGCACTRLSSASVSVRDTVGIVPTVAESLPSSSGEEMSKSDSRRVMDSEILSSWCKNAFSSRMAALRSNFSLISSCMTCSVPLASYHPHKIPHSNPKRQSLHSHVRNIHQSKHDVRAPVPAAPPAAASCPPAARPPPANPC